MSEKYSVCIVGTGVRGHAIAKIVGMNAAKMFEVDDRVNMYIYEGFIHGKRLTQVLDVTSSEELQPGLRLPENVVIMSNLVEAAKNADVLIFAVPHEYITNFCEVLLGKIKPTTFGISLIRGFDWAEGGGFDLISNMITRHLKIPCSVLMSSNLGKEAAEERFCETTIGCRDAKNAKVLRGLFQAEYIRVVVVDDADAVEVCGALKNIVGCGVGIVDGLSLGDNAKAAVIRLGLMEMIRFVDIFYPGSKLATFFESCGISDVISTSYDSDNRKMGEAIARTGKSVERLEQELWNGEVMHGPFAAAIVNNALKNKGLEYKFALFTTVHKICTLQVDAQEIIKCLRYHQEQIYHPTNIFPL